jgi:CRISPR/Cas system-associated endonuclease Cas1
MKTKTVKIALEGFGSYLGMEKGCFIVKNKEGNTEKYPLFESEISEIQIKSGNTISSGVLACCGLARALFSSELRAFHTLGL